MKYIDDGLVLIVITFCAAIMIFGLFSAARQAFNRRFKNGK